MAYYLRDSGLQLGAGIARGADNFINAYQQAQQFKIAQANAKAQQDLNNMKLQLEIAKLKKETEPQIVDALKINAALNMVDNGVPGAEKILQQGYSKAFENAQTPAQAEFLGSAMGSLIQKRVNLGKQVKGTFDDFDAPAPAQQMPWQFSMNPAEQAVFQKAYTARTSSNIAAGRNQTQLQIAQLNNDEKKQLQEMINQGKIDFQTLVNNGQQVVQQLRNVGALTTQQSRNEGALATQDRRNEGTQAVANTNAGAKVQSAQIGAGARVQSAQIGANARVQSAKIGASARAAGKAKDPVEQSILTQITGTQKSINDFLKANPGLSMETAAQKDSRFKALVDQQNKLFDTYQAHTGKAYPGAQKPAQPAAQPAPFQNGAGPIPLAPAAAPAKAPAGQLINWDPKSGQMPSVKTGDILSTPQGQFRVINDKGDIELVK